MNKKYDIEYIKKDIAETNDPNLGRTFNYYQRTFSIQHKESMGYLRDEEALNEEKRNKEEIINNFAEFFYHHPQAYFYYQLLDPNSLNTKMKNLKK
ncbi:hypothetical protein [Mycoplasma sp. 'Moose RK']|uniref:hypothetical protein n=1 Tax=Mycoplasma sp. 'Moose RK' TaxID=2780095 RepID=UPI0018C3385D|nr:hypothetical protein [Mycoplasma sp. 'Moose RK']MBG0731018.1 hypothetical protein [Mycoplasma sp. 'Moose RK']